MLPYLSTNLYTNHSTKGVSDMDEEEALTQADKVELYNLISMVHGRLHDVAFNVGIGSESTVFAALIDSANELEHLQVTLEDSWQLTEEST